MEHITNLIRERNQKIITQAEVLNTLLLTPQSLNELSLLGSFFLEDLIQQSCEWYKNQ